MKKSLAVLYLLLIVLVLSPIMTTEAQPTVKLMSWFGEGKYWQGYDFSAGGVQTINTIQEEGDISYNPLLSPDFYLGSSCFPVSTTSYHSPIPVINYGNTQLSAITQVPAKNDGRFATQAFAQGNTYGLFTLEGDYVAARIQSISQFGTAGYEMDFSWQYVKQGQPSGELSLTLAAPDKAEYALGDNVRIEGKLTLDGKPVLKETDRGYGPFITLYVKDQSGKELFSVSTPSDKSGYYQFVFEYGSAIPTGFKGTLVVTASATHNSLQAEKTINVKYGIEPAKKILALELFGPKDPIQIGGFDSIGIAGKVTSQGTDVDGVLVTMKVAGQTFQTTTGTHTSGSFNWYWNNDTFLAGNYTVEVTVTKDGYQAATGKVPFTMLGEGYDYQVVMDPIPATLEPGERVPFPGLLTLGGNPHYGWLQIEVKFPNGRKNSYQNVTDDKGRFTHVQPSMREEGNYELVVYYQETGQKISNTYSWTVAKKDTDTPGGGSDPEIPFGGQYKIVDVKYQSPTKIGESLEITGKVVLENEQERIPQEKWQVKVIIKGQDRFNNESKAEYETATKTDGSFSVKADFGVLFDSIAIVARDQDKDWVNQASWFGPLKCLVDINPLISLDQTDYDQGSIIRGTLDLQPSSRPDGWFAGLDLIYQAVGPIGGAENLYFFAAERPDLYSYGEYRGFEHFSWEIPDDAEAGKYELTAYITGFHIGAKTIKETFYINDIRGTILSAYEEPSPDGWSSAQLVGHYSDHTGARIPDADLRAYFRGGAEGAEPREFEMSGKIDSDGSFALDLEPFELFAARGRENPWEKQFWEVTVYADKEKYATSATILRLITPTVRPNLEIVSIDPPLDFLNVKAAKGLNYEQLTDMDINLKIRYNNIFESGAYITVGSQGFWNILHEGNDSGKNHIYNLQLNINGQSKPKWDLRKPDSKWDQLTAEYKGIHLGQAFFQFYYPRFEINEPAQSGLRREAEFQLTGKLFGNMHFDRDNPTIPSPWVRNSIVEVWAKLGNGKVSAVYTMDPPKMDVREMNAWVAVNDGKAEFTIVNSHADRYKLANENIKLEIISRDIVGGVEASDYKQSTDIEIQATAVSDEEGKIDLPLTAKVDPCKLQNEARYYIKVTSDKFPNEILIPIWLRCVKKLEFDLTDASIIPVQTVDLSQGQDHALVAGKVAGVRINLGVDGEIYQPLHRPVNFKILFELLQDGVEKPLVIQEKIVSLHEDGASARWADPEQQINNGGIGEIEIWDHAINGQKPASLEGIETVPVDFIFTPQTPFSKEAKYKVRITVDPDEAYGKKKQAELEGKVHKMKTLRLIVVPVDIDNMDMRFVFEQLDFIYQTYPLGLSNLVVELREPYYTKNIPWSCTSLTHLKEIACGLSKAIGTGGDANNQTRIIGVVNELTWLNERDFILYWAGAIGAVGSYSPSLWDSPINNVTLVRYPENVAYTAAHEIGHSYGLELSEQYKTNPPNGLPVHGLVLRNGQIVNIPSDYKATKSQGPRANWQKYGFKAATAIFDLMGNAGYYLHDNEQELVIEKESQQSWIVYKTWRALFEKLKDPVSQPLYAIRGTIHPENGVNLDPLTVVEGIPDPNLYSEGDYELQLQSTAGEILSSARFGEAEMPGPVILDLPYLGGLGKIVVLKNNQVVGEIMRSANSPELLLPNEPFVNENLRNVTIEWMGNDPDNDPLSYFLHYRKNESEPWYPIAANLSETIYSINLSQLPGGLCSFRVTASDGINLAYAYTEPLQLPPHGPSAFILNGDVEEIEEGEAVLLRGIAYDTSNGIIPDENLFWSSDLDGELGNGSTLLVPLTRDAHEITLTAYDQNGNITVVSSRLWVGEILTGMGSGLQGFWFIGTVLLLLFISLIVMFVLILAMRKKKKQLSH